MGVGGGGVGEWVWVGGGMYGCVCWGGGTRSQLALLLITVHLSHDLHISEYYHKLVEPICSLKSD